VAAHSSLEITVSEIQEKETTVFPSTFELWKFIWTYQTEVEVRP